LKCNHKKAKCVDSRVNINGIRHRRYQCINCGVRYSTIELRVPEGSKKTTEEKFVCDFLGISYRQLKTLQHMIGKENDN